MPDSLALQFPSRGQYYESTDGDTGTIEEGIIYVTQDCVFTSITNDQDPAGHLAGPTYSAGTVLNGDTTQFQLTSGQVYHGRP